MNVLHRIALFFLFSPFFAFAQQVKLPEPLRAPQRTLTCGQAAAQQQLWQQHPERAARQAELDDRWYQMASGSSNSAAKGAPAYTLPVVFHIIHNNGPENLSDLQILAALDQVNDAFAHAGYFSVEGEDTGIRFCLARRTPDGAATTGITHTQSALTNFTMETQDLALKNLIRWDPTRYINIWVVAGINSASSGPGVAGYAYFPSSHGEAEDGIVCEASFLGADPAGNSVLVHELGHYLGLYHTFQGGCPNADCLLDGDRVCDTAPDQAQHSVCPFNSCSTDADAPAPNPFSTDADDPTTNFMDYSALECYAGFTAGQAARMQGVVETVRQSLLDSDGCLDPCTQPIQCLFQAVPAVSVPGQQIQLVNQTTGATTYQWFVEGAPIGPFTDNFYTFGQEGAYHIELIAANSDPNCSGSYSIYHVVDCPVNAGFITSETVISVGETVVFTDTSTGANSWQWLLNGVPAGTNPGFSYTFSSSGIYTVVLTAGNGACTDQAAVAIRVEAPCTGLMELGEYHSTDPVYNKLILHSTLFSQAGDVAGAGVLPVGFDNYKGLLAKWNGAAQLQWVKGVQGRYFHKMLEAPDGNWVAYAIGSPCLLTKIKPDGTVLWTKSFTISGSLSTYLGFNHLAIMPNGDIACCFIADNQNTTYLFRLDANGNLLWQKSFGGYTGCNISPAYDGSNNLWVFIFSDYYFVVSPDGQILNIREPVFTLGQGQYAELIRGNQHPDGSFSLWARTTLPNNDVGLVLYHFSPSGNLLWLRSFDNSGAAQNFEQYYPGDGWLLSLNVDLQHIALRLNEDGSTRWTKRFTGGGPAYVFTGFSGLEESPDGRVAGMNNTPNYKMYLTIFDPQDDAACDLVDFILPPAFQPPVNIQPITKSIIPSYIPFGDFNLVFEDLSLEFEPKCTAPAGCPEICDNGQDDDNDGLADCADPDCQCGPNNVCVPDATATLDSVVCQNGMLRVHLRVCNSAGAEIPVNTPVQFYLGDPVASVATAYGSPYFLPEKIAANTCLNVAFDLPVPPNGLIFGVLNDNGSLPTPFTPDQDFPATTLAECGYANNLFSFQVNYSAPSLDLGPDLLLCNSSVTVLSGGGGFARYRWADGSADSSFTAFGPGVYWLDAWDVCGNLYTDTVHIDLQTALPLDLGPDRIICPGDAIALSVAGFDEVNWAPLSEFSCPDCPNVIAAPDSALTLRVTGRSGNCFVSDSLRVTVAAPPFLSAQVEPAGCSSPTGSIEIAVSQGAPPFNFDWSDGGTGPVREQLLPGDYGVLVSDANGCTSADTFTVAATSPPQILSAQIIPVPCFGENSGQIALQVEGGAPPYQSSWSNGAGGLVLTGLAAGPYALVLTDAAGCTLQVNYDITQPAPLSAGVAHDADTCGQQTGALVLTGSGGVAPYQVLWSNGATGTAVDHLPAGDYSLTLTDANGCTLQQTHAVPAVDIPVSFGLESGLITCATPVVGASAAPGNFAYTWQTPSGVALSGAIQQVDLAGIYSVTATHPSGCTAVQTLLVGIDTLTPLAVIANAAVQIPCDQSAVVLDGTGSSSGPDIQLEWSQEQGGLWTTVGTGAVWATNVPGRYRLLVIDEINGCSAADTILVGVSEGIGGVWLGADSVSCFGWSDGVVRVDSVSGGAAPFEFALNQQAFGPEPLFVDLPPGGYTVRVRDAAGCLAQDSVVVGEPALLQLDLTASVNPVSPGEILSLTAEIEPAGTLLSGLEWEPAPLFPAQNQLFQILDLEDTTLIRLTVTTPEGCTATAQLRIDVRAGQVYRPNAFRPGGPAENANFTVYGGPELQEIELLQVFDRWGAMVFERRNFPPNNPALGWDGRFRGRELPAGVYVYHVELRFANGDRQVIKGEVVIVR
ncbi:MAG: gliding motility-associated C-terminal domain-containing protein [Saprospiraceae bacterium]|nr:gliding motility-associated C-terminal domain-containing protein [Saprospiraceae bacterium]